MLDLPNCIHNLQTANTYIGHNLMTLSIQCLPVYNVLQVEKYSNACLMPIQLKLYITRAAELIRLVWFWPDHFSKKVQTSKYFSANQLTKNQMQD